MGTRLDKGVQLLITTDGELQMTRRNTLHLWGSSVAWSGQPGSRWQLMAKGTQAQADGRNHGRARGGWQGSDAAAARTLRSLEALPASSSTSAVRYSAADTGGRQVAIPSAGRVGGPIGTECRPRVSR